MNIQEIKIYLKNNKISYDQLSQMSGVGLNTIKSIFSGRTQNPRIDTINAIKDCLGLNEKEPTPELVRNKLLKDLADKNIQLEDLDRLTPTQRELVTVMIQQLLNKK